jgi:hypothetical protein
MSKGTIMHELLHIVGFQHEQSRSDRDDYVDVIFDNIVQQAQMQKNFNRHDTKNLVIYDYNSVMQYPRKVLNFDRFDNVQIMDSKPIKIITE